MNTLRFLPVILGILFAFSSTAQSSGNQYKAVDDYVKSLGRLDTLNMGTISQVVTKKFPEAKEKVRAIFTWIALNISYDLKAGRNNENEKTSSDLVLKTRKASAAGYAGLFQDMCSVQKIRCLTVDGYVKYKPEDINEKPDEFNHTWAVVQLGQSPDTWFYVDPTWGSGYTDDKMKVFTPAFNDAYFFSDRLVFNYQHFPDNGAWQLGPGPKNVTAFFSQPVVKEAAYDFNLGKYAPADGYLKTTLNKAVSFILNVQPTTNVDIVSLEIGTDKKKKVKTMDHVYTGKSINFTYKFDIEDVYPVTILINNKPILSYMVEVNE